ncbi:Alpha/Beta hydrolase protein [Paraphoma chrysanthemicola]|nr:Alpha/Beta hydrolase protein [Paraphoma chrysanthemicola]
MSNEVPPLHPQWVAATEAMGEMLSFSDDSVEGSRAIFRELMAALAKLRQESAGAKSVEAREVQVGEQLRARIYIPPHHPRRSSRVDERLPVGLYIHSGGWYSGSVDEEDFMCRYIAYNSRIILISPEYRLAPENPFPASLEDCFKTYEYIHDHANEFGGSPRHKFIMGGSAGGNLSACVALKYTSDPELKAAGLLLSCMPSCDPIALPAKYKKRYTPERFMDTPFINTNSTRRARELLQPPRPDHPLYSPLLHPDIKLLPPTYITAMTNDPTYQETSFFYEECKKKGVEADFVEWYGLPHFFWIMPGMEKSGEYMRKLNEKLRGMINQLPDGEE